MKRATEVLPPEFLERLRRIVPPERWDTILETFEQPKPTTFRVNTLKADSATVRDQLQSQGFELEPVAWYPAAFILRSPRLQDLQATDAYRTGAIYVQSLSSMLPALILDPQPGEHVLDLTAAPGGKTTQMTCLMQGAGRIVANDNHRIRFYKLKANVEAQGTANVELSRRPGEWFGARQPDTFNRVLVDAPCSTEGRFYTGRASSYDYWKERKIHEVVGKQRRLILAGARALKPGGTLVYSTCTFGPEENEGVVDWLLTQMGVVLAVEEIRLPIPNTMPGLTAWDAAPFDGSLTKTPRILPTRQMEGFFLAKLRKRAKSS